MVNDETVWELSVHREGGRARLDAVGDLDLDTAPKLLTEVVGQLDSGATELVIDLTALAFIDSSGLGTLVGCWRRAQQKGATLIVANPNDDVSMTLEITGLDQILPIRDERQAA
ncbi:STAS domain-containing protein [Dactylosporangium sp. NPDC005555]|uniref:STAS domain-containing protein n=1 Tax=Dactylosporangium sp. NPDC005555 TaxID=3154889 RepID=UPI0033B34AA0